MKRATKPGYWWLAYSWDNWLFACELCNSTWKMNQFPLSTGTFSPVDGCEQRETPLLLNPFDDDPEPELEFNELGCISGLSPRGTATIHVCGLDRWKLEQERGRIATAVLRWVDEWSDGPLSEAHRRSLLRNLADACQPDAPFAGLCRSLIEQRRPGGLGWRDLVTAATPTSSTRGGGAPGIRRDAGGDASPTHEQDPRPVGPRA